MIYKLLNKYRKQYLSVWTVLAIDALFTFCAYILSLVIWDRFGILSESVIIQIGFYPLIGKAILVTAIYTLFFYFFKVNQGILRHATIYEGKVILNASLIAFFILFVYANLNYQFVNHLNNKEKSIFYLPRIALAFHFLITVIGLIVYRILIKDFFDRFSKGLVTITNKVLIYGSGASGYITYSALKKDQNAIYNVFAFIDDDKRKQGKKIEGVPIISEEKALELASKNNINILIISIQKIHSSRKQEIVSNFLNYDIQIKDVPPVEDWINDELTTTQIKNIKVEDLLSRKPIVLDSHNIHHEIKNKIVLVTGAAGSIGSEIIRQLIHFQPRKVIAIDQAESALYDLQIEIQQAFPSLFPLIEFIIANVKDYQRVKYIFQVHQPQIVYHAAAYKHVPLMEKYPVEAVKVNVFGTKNLADLAVKYKVDKFVMISTDKAVNPTNVMGASKRLAEMYIQSLEKIQDRTQFITTRFGNVLGSNGSVIPLFRKQIEKGGPITITHKAITRYFMTIPEACNLVLEAGAMGEGGEIFVFDMGKSIKIYDLAINMIKLSGFKPHKDIKIIEVGLRPGEKLYEELLNSAENTLPTHHEKILKAKVREECFEIINGTIITIQTLTEGQEDDLIRIIKRLIPEYISNNSRFEKFDKIK